VRDDPNRKIMERLAFLEGVAARHEGEIALLKKRIEALEPKQTQAVGFFADEPRHNTTKGQEKQT